MGVTDCNCIYSRSMSEPRPRKCLKCGVPEDGSPVPTREELLKALLVRMMEESGEIVQAASKFHRFGWDSKHPDRPNGLNNAEHLAFEVGQLFAIVMAMGLHMQDGYTAGITDALLKLKRDGLVEE